MMATEYLEDYELVESRLRRLYTAYPKARVLTDLVHNDDRRFVVKAEVYLTPEDLTPSATGYAEEIVGAGFVNKTSALENCETSAIGRAISNSVLCLGAPEGKRPSRQEMEKVERYKAEPRKPAPKTKAPEATPEQIAKAALKIGEAKGLNDLDKLREIWTANGDLLDVKVDNTTLKDVINRRVKEIGDANE
jgi:hypothetical protein